ncbi:MAG: hypothetical protein V5A40_19680 [Haloarculaceae archaeon]
MLTGTLACSIPSRTNPWQERFEEWRATAFLIAGVVFVADAALLTADIAAGTEPMAFGQGLIGTAWTAAFLGLLGFYPGLSDVAGLFVLGVFPGIVLGFGSFGVASLRTDVYARPVGLLFLVLVLTFLFNLGTGIAGFNPLGKVLGVVCVLALTMLAIGYLLRTGSALADREGVEASSEASAG